MKQKARRSTALLLFFFLLTGCGGESLLQGRELLDDSVQLAAAIDGLTCAEVTALLGEPDGTDPYDTYTASDGTTVEIRYNRETDLVGRIKVEEQTLLFSMIERTGEAQALIDDIDLLADAIQGRTYLEVEELLGPPDSQGSGFFLYGYINSDHGRVNIYFDRESLQPITIKTDERTIDLNE